MNSDCDDEALLKTMFMRAANDRELFAVALDWTAALEALEQPKCR